MTARPGGTWWLLCHEVRMYFSGLRQVRADGKQKRADRLAIVVWLLLQAGLHWAAYYIVRAVHMYGMPAPQAAVLLNGVAIGCSTLMLSAGLRGSVAALFERGDMDLLLSSPLPAHSIFSARLAGIAVSIAAMFLFFLAPLANMGALAGQLNWLAIYPVIAGTALLAASLAMMGTLGLVRLLGTRRTRVLAQVLGAVSGALVFAMTQLAGSTGGYRTATLRWLLPRLSGDGWSRMLPSHALLGEVLPMLVLLIIGVAAFLLSVRCTREFFIRGVEQAAGMAQAARAPRRGVRFRFGRGPAGAVIVKEWRLIARDLQLVSQVLLRLLYLAPACLMLFKSGNALHGAGAALTFLCGSLAGSLAWIIIAAEDAPDLLAGAPVSAGTVRRAKLAAAASPPLALVALPLLWFAAHAPGPGLATLISATLATVGAVYVVLWCGRPAVRADFNRRSKRNARSGLLELASNAGWAGAIYVLLAGTAGIGGVHYLGWSALAIAGALLAAGLAWASRTRA